MTWIYVSSVSDSTFCDEALFCITSLLGDHLHHTNTNKHVGQ